MGSDSDLPIVEKAITTLKEFNVPTEVHVFSAHRTPEEARAFAMSARANGFGAILAAAGKAAHLAGAIAANTTLPVIGIPVKSSTLDGIDALLSTVQMPSGIPVATVAIDGAVNAALLAVEILSVSDEALAKALDDRRKADTAKTLEKNKAIEENQEISYNKKNLSFTPWRKDILKEMMGNNSEIKNVENYLYNIYFSMEQNLKKKDFVNLLNLLKYF